MAEQAEQPKPEEPGRMTETREIPPLIVRRDALVFSAGDQSVTVKLSALMEKGEGAVFGLLLWGVLLKLHDLELDFRRALDAGEKRADEALSLANDPGALLGHITTALSKMGVELPEGGLGAILSSGGPKPTPSGPTHEADGRG